MTQQARSEFMSETVPAICRECGMRTKVTFKASTIETIVSDKISKCHHALEGMAVVGCPSMKQEIAAILRTQEKKALPNGQGHN